MDYTTWTTEIANLVEGLNHLVISVEAAAEVDATVHELEIQVKSAARHLRLADNELTEVLENATATAGDSG